MLRELGDLGRELVPQPDAPAPVRAVQHRGEHLERHAPEGDVVLIGVESDSQIDLRQRLQAEPLDEIDEETDLYSVAGRERKLFEATVGSLEQLVGDLIEPQLRRLDEILSDEVLLETVVGRLAGRHPRSRTRGRPGTPAEVVLRLLVLKRLKGWTFEETEREVRKSLVYRYLTRVYFERVPDAKTLIRLSGVVGSEGVERIHRRIVDIAKEERVIRGRRARVDTTVEETNIRYPTDSRLLADGVRVLTRNLKRIEEATTQVGRRVRDRMRSATRRVVEIARAARGRMREASRERMRRGYERLLEIVRATVRDANRVIGEIAEGVRVAVSREALIMLEAGRTQVEHFLPLVDPIFEYGRASGQSITGGYVYRGEALGARFAGRYFFADNCGGWVKSFPYTGDAAVGAEFEGAGGPADEAAGRVTITSK